MAEQVELEETDGYNKLTYKMRNDGNGLTIYHIGNMCVDIHKEHILAIAAEILGVDNGP